ncbi:branched-chain amino acid ABC transporter permease [Microbacterium sp.]|uniref:branched-chain amino acid ABC transporter permease n=1 Tax=Microbacterium sp. TaxID=51671 RepID=UPI0009266A47|nr:branched-chain amino acid ABC transporter permease [Microbacterium sp.]MBN9193568.1 branched-chain amino acid ABC transporter permease [Microbacterium sp.]OJU57953.1 MAG: branched-chain amino acid ABC transporter permease [Microbacterium sp. 70-38]
MADLLTYLISGLALAGSFALIGSGIVVVYRVTHVLNFAQGTFAVFGGMISASLLGGLLPHGVAELVAVLCCAVIGVIVGFAAVGRRGTPPMISLLVTLGMAMIGQAVVVTVWGQTPVSPPGFSGTIDILGVSLETQRVVVFVAALITFALLSLFFARTDIGKALTAAASNPRAARLVGIDTRLMGLVAFAIAGALGGLAGVLIAPTTAVSVSSDLPLVLSGLAAAIFGGLRSPWLTFVGAVILGVVGQLVAGYANGSYQTQIALVMMLVIMIARAGRMTAEEAK